VKERKEIRLWDSQWVNVVNADWSGMDVEQAVCAAVKMTEALMATNYAIANWPPAKEGEGE
jgi:hypothetical protein